MMIETQEGLKAVENIYELSREEALKSLGSSERGLSFKEAQERLQRYGRNEIEAVRKTPFIYRFLLHFVHLFAILLWVAALLSFIVGMPTFAIAIILVILINAVFSSIQE